MRGCRFIYSAVAYSCMYNELDNLNLNKEFKLFLREKKITAKDIHIYD